MTRSYGLVPLSRHYWESDLKNKPFNCVSILQNVTKERYEYIIIFILATIINPIKKINLSGIHQPATNIIGKNYFD